ncbi:MAG: type II toxin-antitoxin system RelE/ParE family toxin [Thermodesulfobacteriota bacterium]
MNHSVWFHPDAEAEINEAAAFLELESPGLGEMFLNDLEHAIEVIVSYPQLAPLIRGRARKKSLRKFPYLLIYSVKVKAQRFASWRSRTSDAVLSTGG